MPREKHVIVVGLGNVGYRTWDELIRAGYEVVAIDTNPEREFVSAIRPRCPVIIGDARLTSTLGAAGLERAAAVIAATGDDAVNLAVALTVRRIAPDVRTVIRVFDADFANKLEQGALVRNAISTSRVAAPAFAASALFSDVAGAFADDHGLVAMRFHRAPEDWSGRSPADLGLNVLFVEREGRLSAWDPDAPLPKGANVLAAERRRYV